MEQHIHFFPILLTSFAFLFILFKIVKRTKPTKLPPSPWKLPIIGNMHQLASGSLPHQTLRDLAKKHGPLMYLKLGEVPTYVVSSPDVAKELLTKPNDIMFSDRPYLLTANVMTDDSSLVFSPYGNYWKQLRKICTFELLNPSRVQSFRSIREDEVSNLITTISSAQGSPINLSKMVFAVTHRILSRAAFGDHSKHQESYVTIIEKVLKLAGGFSVSDMFPSSRILEMLSGMRPKLEKLHRESDVILESIIKQHREKEIDGGAEDHQKDLVDVLLELQRRGELEVPLTDTSIKAVIFDMFNAGSETSSTTVEWAMSEMVKNPDIMEKAQAEVREVFGKKGNVDETGLQELKFLKAVIKETLRLHPSIPIIPRQCRENCVISGYEIPAKTKVIVNGWAVGRDPKYWSEAERFYPERFLDSPVDYKGSHFHYIPFGGGRRICPGISFAQPDIELPLAKFLYHFDWKLPNGTRPQDLDMTEDFGLTVGRKENLFLIPIPYHPSP